MPANKGFTLVELILVMGIFAILASLITISIATTQSRALLAQVVDVLVADMRSQQARAMTGAGDANGSSSDYGIYFTTNNYVMFAGSSYNASDPANSLVDLPDGMVIENITWGGSSVIFNRMSGEVAGYSAVADSVTVSHGGTGDTRTLELNRYGAVTKDR